MVFWMGGWDYFCFWLWLYSQYAQRRAKKARLIPITFPFQSEEKTRSAAAGIAQSKNTKALNNVRSTGLSLKS